MVVAPRQMRRAHYHQPADVTVRGNVADLRETTRAQEALAPQLRVAHAQARRGRVWEARGEAHHHEVRGRVRRWTAGGTRDGALRGRGDELEEEVLEVPLVKRDAKLAYLGEDEDASVCRAREAATHRRFSRRARGRSSSRLRARRLRCGFGP